MRNAATLAISLLLPCALWAQTGTAPTTGHFDGWPSSQIWGADKQSFEATTVRFRQRLGLFTVAENGFGWRPAFTDSDGSFFRWEEIAAWCWAPETLQIRTGEARFPVGYHDIAQEDLTTIVDTYLRQYAAELEVSNSEQACTTATLGLPDNAREKIIELLEAASSENR